MHFEQLAALADALVNVLQKVEFDGPNQPSIPNVFVSEWKILSEAIEHIQSYPEGVEVNVSSFAARPGGDVWLPLAIGVYKHATLLFDTTVANNSVCRTFDKAFRLRRHHT